MLSSKCLVFFLLQIIFPCGRGENAFLIFPQLPSENVDWNDLDAEGLRIILSGPLEAGNVTLVAYENIYDSDGSLQQINTIELTILYQGASDKSYPYYYGGQDTVLDFVHIKDNLYKETGTLLSGTQQQFWRYLHSPSDYLFALNQNQDVFYLEHNKMLRGSRNTTAKNIEQVKVFAKWLEERTNLPISILTWNASNELDKENSVIVPFILASVGQCINGTIEMFEAALAGLSEAHLIEPDNIFQSLSLYMQKKIPGYRWHVSEPYIYLTFPTDVQSELYYNNVQVWEDPQRLMLFGVKKPVLKME